MVHILLLSTRCVDSYPCVVAVTENSRILFDVGEGTQRLCVEHGVKLSKVNDVFMTRFSPECMGGLPGLCLTMTELIKTEVRLHGPDKLADFLQATHHFMRIACDKFKVPPVIGLPSTIHVCDELTVHALRFSLNSSSCTHMCYVGETAVIKGKFDVNKAAELNVPKGPLYGKLKNGQSISLANGVVIEPHQVLGDAEPSRYFIIFCDISDDVDALLTSITNDALISRFFTGGDLHGQLECIVHLSPKVVLQSSRYQSFMGSFLSLVHHITACDGDSSFVATAIHTAKLQSICPSLFSTLPSNSKFSSSTYQDSSFQFIQGQPLLRITLSPQHKRGIERSTFPDIQQEVQQFIDDAHLSNVDLSRDMLKVQLVQDSVTPATISSDTYELTESLKLDSPGGDQLRLHSENRLLFLGTGCAVPSKYRNVSGILLQFATTHSCMLIDIGEGTWQQMMKISLGTPLLFADVEDKSTLNFIETMDESIRAGLNVSLQLKLVWISHPHADHHLGLISIILQRRLLLLKYAPTVLFEPLVVIAGPSILLFLHDSCKLFDGLKEGYVGISSRQFDPLDKCEYSDSYFDVLNGIDGKTHQTSSELMEVTEDRPRRKRYDRIVEHGMCYLQMSTAALIAKRCFESLGIASLSNVPVTHCSQSYGLIVESVIASPQPLSSSTTYPFKLVYSGDTRPCPSLVTWGKNATILIHEATFEDDKLSEAINKRHSTIGEALDCGVGMNAYRTILTHFSQRYPSMPVIEVPNLNGGNENDISSLQFNDTLSYRRLASRQDINCVVAFDYMLVSFHDLLWTPALIPVLEKAFPCPTDVNENEDIEEGQQGFKTAGQLDSFNCVCSNGSCGQNNQFCVSSKINQKKKGKDLKRKAEDNVNL